MQAGILYRFLIGRREAILEVAGNRRFLFVGFMFVLSAGLAREYDGAYLVAEPWHLLIPLGASLVASFCLFGLFFITLRKRLENRPGFLVGYRAFLALFWMTAPLAWLYAVPYEQFLSPYWATAANLITLALVSLWRVLLVTRAASVIFGIGYLGALFPVLMFASLASVAAAGLSPLPIVGIMGGIRHPPEDQLIVEAVTTTMCLWPPVFLITLIGAVVVTSRNQGRWSVSQRCDNSRTPRTNTLAILAIASVVLWFAILPLTQDAQRLAHLANGHLKAGRIREGLAVLSNHPREAFPPHFDPRPRRWTGQTTPDILEVMQVIAEDGTADWVRSAYVRKLRQDATRRGVGWTLSGERLSKLVSILEKIPEGSSVAAEISQSAESRLRYDPSGLEADERRLLERLIEIAAASKEEND